jgi:hypothetical protein
MFSGSSDISPSKKIWTLRENNKWHGPGLAAAVNQNSEAPMRPGFHLLPIQNGSATLTPAEYVPVLRPMSTVVANA